MTRVGPGLEVQEGKPLTVISNSYAKDGDLGSVGPGLDVQEGTLRLSGPFICGKSAPDEIIFGVDPETIPVY